MPQAEIDPGASYLRRLTNSEYNHTLHDLLGESGEVLDRAAAFELVPDNRVHGFESNATNVNVSRAVVQRYLDAAEIVSEEVTSTPAVRLRVFGCDPAQGDEQERAACSASFIESFGQRAYRRPLQADEIAELTQLWNSAADPVQGARLVLEQILLSPNFIFRIEEGVADADRPGLMRLGGYEIATRLSYLLLGTTPSAELLQAAESGELDSAAGVASAAGLMLDDPRAKQAVRRFFEQWLRLDRLATLQPDAELFPEFDGELAASMREETTRLVDRLVWEPGRSLLELVSSAETEVDPRLAALYGLSAPADWQLMPYPADMRRRGLLGHAGILTLTSHRTRTSAVLRGKYVREVLLCYEMPPVPAQVPMLAEAEAGQSEQQRMAAHSTDPNCAGCHQLMDPIGTGLSEFDAIGKFRQLDESGAQLVSAGAINGYPELDLAEFDGPIELSERLQSLPALPRCMVTQLFRHAFARVESAADEPLIDSVTEAFQASNYSFSEMLLTFVTSDAFRYRQPNAKQGEWE